MRRVGLAAPVALRPSAAHSVLAPRQGWCNASCEGSMSSPRTVDASLLVWASRYEKFLDNLIRRLLTEPIHALLVHGWTASSSSPPIAPRLRSIRL